ncbi:MAG TPA: serine/threonine-protein kinase [Blastocatellia bacterium]|nr:serine/threonine-protein kinase [Blastocatellia bacterium]
MDPERWQLIRQVFHQAVELPAGERAGYVSRASGGDESLRTEIESLLASHDQAESFIESKDDQVETVAQSSNRAQEMIGRRVGPYKIVREIGRGGMGAVYLGVRADDQFSKRVAIKLVLSDMNTGFIVRQFLSERQILANLDHPNIARLLDGGTTEEGLPYFVMEYIEGQPIREYCDTHRLSTEERLALFREVCSAVHFAHQNLVIHRDIKPSNILVTSDGKIKLLDFGIARLLAPGPGYGEMTQARVMTPDYASPEQARGDPITTASDIYSLGVLLYELLSGHRPYRITTASQPEIIRAICEEEPGKPSTAIARVETIPGRDGDTEVTLTPESVSKARGSEPDKLRRQLEGDLDNIVLKALRKEPQRRYVSAEQFSEDIRRYTEGLPVIARKDTFSYRASKFVRRHRAAVAAAALTSVVLLAGAGATAWEAHLANVQRDKAQRRFNEVRKLANAVLFKYHDSIEKLPGSTPVREMLVKDALEYLDNLSRDSEGDVQLQRELAEAYKKVGEVQGGVSVGGNTGDTAGMVESYRKSLDIREKIARTRDATSDDRRNLARTYNSVADALQRTGDPAGGLELSRKALEIYTALAAPDPAGITTRSDVALADWHVANMLGTIGNYPEAIDTYWKAARIYQELATAEPSNPNHKRNQVLTYKYLGSLLELTGDVQGALDLSRKAVATDQALVDVEPNDASAKLDLSFSYGVLAKALTRTGDLDGALESARKALELALAVSEADPKNAFAKGALGKAYRGLGEAARRRGDVASAVDSDRKAVDTFEALLASDPKNGQDRTSAAGSYSQLGEVYMDIASKSKSPAERSEAWRTARSWLERGSEAWAEAGRRGPLPRAYQEEPQRLVGEIAQCDAALSALAKK